uniref:Uncharacterized protein n=1 Tax=Mantoniella antarctica TaxID=81844 RepID=A0A7S0X5L4_9CHLO|mmetsp:Transcript_15377/g.37816  ORF Transcript_15377/g.37816 Transcript_15377/m.37816 type:complete len:290 (+) Transcript_15377:63-932(+)
MARANRWGVLATTLVLAILTFASLAAVAADDDYDDEPPTARALHVTGEAAGDSSGRGAVDEEATSDDFVGTVALEYEDGDRDYDNDAASASPKVDATAAAEAAEAAARAWEADAEAEAAVEARALGGAESAAGELAGKAPDASKPNARAAAAAADDDGRALAAREKQEEELRIRHIKEAAAKNETATRIATAKEARDGAQAARKAAMAAAEKVAEDDRRRREEEVLANKRETDEARGSRGAPDDRGSDHRQRTADIKRAVHERVEEARLQMEMARAASRAGQGRHHEGL